MASVYNRQHLYAAQFTSWRLSLVALVASSMRLLRDLEGLMIELKIRLGTIRISDHTLDTHTYKFTD